MSEVTFSNGDVYIGNSKGTIPNGKGKYIWSDGTVYEGDWEEGKITGKGQAIWSSGMTYDGEFAGGYLHGFGTFTKPDGSVYRGSWRFNIQNGLGRKQYPNSDVYDGSWKEGVLEGSGRYAWSNGNMYIGNWKSGEMCGRGVMKWLNGDVYDGFWLNGLKHGSGVYKFADGNYYFGTWTRGLKDGQGTFYTFGYKRPSSGISDRYDDERRNGLLSQASSPKSEECRTTKPSLIRSLSSRILFKGILKKPGQILSKTIFGSIKDSNEEFLSSNASEVSRNSVDCLSEVEDNHNPDVIYEREYMQGVLIRERIKKSAGLLSKSKQRLEFSAKDAKIRSRVDNFEGHKSYCLMLDLQLGIRYTVGKITPVPMREVRRSDFVARARIQMFFPRNGSQFTPPHYTVDFYWKDYCPMVFRNLREMFKLDAADYMMSICGDDGLRELSSPGKSGSLFYLSHDDRFVIKTLKGTELKVLLKMLPSYYKHVKEHDNTLITKFFGVHEITLKGGKKMRFVVMGNMFCTELRIHRRYDLKGSYQGRYTNKEERDESTTLKDLDLSYEFHMDKLLRESLFKWISFFGLPGYPQAFITSVFDDFNSIYKNQQYFVLSKQISLDCMFLESQKIIDYSLLLGLHFCAPEHLKALLEPPDSVEKIDQAPPAAGDEISYGDLFIQPKGLLLVTHEPSSVNSAPGPHIRGSTLKAASVGDQEVDLLLPGTGRLRVQLGVNMPAHANHKVLEYETDSSEVELFEYYDVVLYLGLIDILQDYNLKKKIEHSYKSLWFDPMSISSINPKLYSKRFVQFLEKVFPAEPN